MRALGTVVTEWDIFAPLLGLGLVVVLIGTAVFSIVRHRDRWWGILQAVCCVVAAVGIVRSFLIQREEEAESYRVFQTEIDLGSLVSRARSLRIFRRDLQDADGDALMGAFMADLTVGDYHHMKNDAGALVDRWKNPIRFEVDADGGVVVASSGPDGAFGTGDDLR
ncbi:hypothetical protein OKA05_29005 [Luteolibacter arcticus]|uniref:Type II secretion system protein GspG C-terminal domain-containing protein n=1 Tax=Luteolibacter arcticus TaxID=1581411 RepID=A0ABT3GSY8_9BACT|nr:hypothetical protein [Luteolibacter arcticus]MCW1926627.1 hypothetical protein [Luteolibacter arcticus]